MLLVDDGSEEDEDSQEEGEDEEEDEWDDVHYEITLSPLAFWALEDPGICRIVERSDQEAHLHACTKAFVIRLTIKQPPLRKRPLFKPYIQELKVKRLAMKEERHRCHHQLAKAEKHVKAIQEEIRNAEGNVRRLARKTELQITDFATFVQKRYDNDLFGTSNAILDSPLGKQEVRNFLQQRHPPLMSSSNSFATIGKQSIDKSLSLSLTSLLSISTSTGGGDASRRRPTMVETESLTTISTSSTIAAVTAPAVKGSLIPDPLERKALLADVGEPKTNCRRHNRTPKTLRGTKLSQQLRALDDIGTDKLEVTPEIREFITELLGLWQEAKELIETSREQKRPVRHHDCQDFFKHVIKSVVWESNLFADDCCQLVEEVTAEGNKAPVPATTFQTLTKDLCLLFHTYLLPAFIISDAFIEFLKKGSAQFLFTGISKKSGAGKKNDDVDAQGRKRTNQDDEFMDSNFVHGGRQRVKAALVYPQLLAKHEQLKQLIFETKGKLSVILEHVYTLAAVEVQRIYRGHISRIKAYDALVMISRNVTYTAALEIQRIGRGYIWRRDYPKLLHKWKTKMAIKIQSRVRVFIAKNLVQALTNFENPRFKSEKALSIQKAWRIHYKMRKALEDFGLLRTARIHEEDREWAAEMIQRMYRGHLARQLLVPSRRIELSLNNTLVQLAETYLVNGNIKQLLLGTNELLRQSMEDMLEAKRQEETQVQSFREQACYYHRRSTMTFLLTDFFAAYLQLLKVRIPGDSGDASTPFHSPPLGLLDKKPRRSKTYISRMKELRQIYNISEQTAMPGRRKPNNNPPSIVEESSNNSSSFDCDSSVDSNQAQVQYPHLSGIVMKDEDSGDEDDISALTEYGCVGSKDRLTAKQYLKSLRQAEAAADPHYSKSHQSSHHHPHKTLLPEGARTIRTTPRGHHSKQVSNPANLFAQDPLVALSAGLDESIEKLLRVAVLRVFVPPTLPENTTPEDAYQWYVDLPLCLEKVKHEKEACAIAHQLALDYEEAGYKHIRDLLPSQEREEEIGSLIENQGLSQELVGVIASMVDSLHKVDILSKFGTVATKERFRPYQGAVETAYNLVVLQDRVKVNYSR